MSVSLLLFLFALWLNMDASSSQTAPVGCGRPPALENGDTIGTTGFQYNHNDRVQYVCQSIYTMRGSPFKICNDGQWIGEMTCLRPCTVTRELMNSNNIRFKFKPDDKMHAAHGEGLTFKCTSGTTAVNPRSMRRYCIDGVMDLPRCV